MIQLLYIYVALLFINVFAAYVGENFATYGADKLHPFINATTHDDIETQTHRFENLDIISILGDLGKMVETFFKIVSITYLASFLTGIVGLDGTFVDYLLVPISFMSLALIWHFVSGRQTW